MKIKQVTRYTIPLEGSRESLGFDGGSTALEVYRAIGLLPPTAVISTDYGHIMATFVHPDIEVPGTEPSN